MDPGGNSERLESPASGPLPASPEATWETETEHRRIARDQLKQLLAAELDSALMEELVGGLVKQWGRFDGHADIFLPPDLQFSFILTGIADQPCQVTICKGVLCLEPLLSFIKFPAELISDVLTLLGMGQEVEFQDFKKIPSIIVWHDPRTNQVMSHVPTLEPPTTLEQFSGGVLSNAESSLHDPDSQEPKALEDQTL